MDDAYNRYAFEADEDAPEWFLEDERQFMRPGGGGRCNVPTEREGGREERRESL